jgi:hypothetical protein
MHRSSWLVLTLSAAFLAAPSLASAEPQLSMQFTTKAPKSSSGLKLTLSGLGGKAIDGFRFTFAPGTRTDPKGAPACRASRDKRYADGHAAACPALSKLGTAEAELASDPVQTLSMTAWYVLALDALKIPTINLEYKLGDTINAEPVDVVKNAYSMAFDSSTGLALNRLSASFTARSIGRHAFLRTPASCTKKGWTNKATIRWHDGTTSTLTSVSPCNRQRSRTQGD